MGINQEKKWQPYRIGDVASIKNGFAFKSTDFQSTGIPLIRQSQLREDDVDLSEAICLDEKFLTSHKDYLVKKDDVLLGMSGSIGKISYYKYDYPALQNQRVGKLEIKDENILSKKFFLSFLMHKIDLLVEKSRGMGVQNISSKDIESIEILLPDIDIQHSIVEKIETLFSELDNSVANLKAAKAQLKRYRQSVLNSAFEGKLTVAWRKANGDKLETAEALMERIKAERDVAYETKLIEWQEAVISWENGGKEGKKPSKPTKPKDFSPLSPEDMISLPELPKEWCYSNLGNLNLKISDGPFGSNLKSSDYVDNGVRVIRLENIGNLEFYDDKKTYITEEKYETIKKHTVKSGDIIFSSFIASDGTSVVKLPSNIDKAVNKADCFCIRVFGQTVSTEYLTFFLSSRNVYAQLEVQVHGATRPRINTTQLSFCQIPTPSTVEQLQIVNEIESRLSEADVMERTIDESLIKVEKIRQSILKKAFEGKLV